MRQNLIYGFAMAAVLLITWNLYTVFMNVPDEANQGAVFRIIYFHVPAALTSFVGFYVGMFFGVAYLIRKDLRFDAIAAPINEVSLAFAVTALVTGMIWGRITW